MNTKIKNKILAAVVGIAAIGLPAFILGKWIEGIVFFFAHWFIREQFPKQYHHIVPGMCRLITSIVFFFGVSFVLPFALSLFSAIPICYFASWVGFTKKQADEYEVECLRLRQTLEAYDNPTRIIIEKCRKSNFSKRDTEIAVKYYIEKWTPKEIWLWLCEQKQYESIEWDSVYKLLWRLGKRLK